jgi:hypothetical protein
MAGVARPAVLSYAAAFLLKSDIIELLIVVAQDLSPTTSRAWRVTLPGEAARSYTDLR